MSRWPDPPRCAACGKPIDPKDCVRLTMQRIKRASRECRDWKGREYTVSGTTAKRVIRQQQFCEDCAPDAIAKVKALRRSDD